MKIFLAKTFDSAADGLIEELKKNLTDKDTRHIVIVPEKFTLSGEKIIFDKLEICGADNLEITSFSRLAEKTVNTRKKCLSAAGSLMLFTKAVLDVSDKLVKYRNCSKLTGFYQEMYSVIALLRNSGVSPDELLKLQLPKITRLKIEEIALLYDSYTMLLREQYYDATSLYEEFAASIAENAEFADSRIFILDYYFFSKVQYDIIGRLIDFSKGVYISLPQNEYAKNERIFPKNTLETLKAICCEKSEICSISVCPTKLKSDFEMIADNLFSYEKCKRTVTENIKLFSNESAEKEVEFAAVKINELILDEQYRYKDIALVTGSIEEYAPFIKNIFKRYNIPFFINKKEPMIFQAGVRFLSDSLRVVNNNYDKADILKLAINPFSDISKEEYYDFDNYIAKYGINHSKFTVPFNLGSDDELYVNAEKVRKKLVSRLALFCDKKINADYVSTVKTYLKDCEFLENTNRFIEGQIACDNEFYAPITVQAYDKLFAVLNEYENILGGEQSSLEEFSITIDNMIADIEIGMVPYFADSVYIGEASESMYAGVKAMLVLGAGQGVIPKTQGNTPILSVNDIEMLFSQNVVVEPNPKSANRDSYFYVLQLLITPTDKLFISYNEGKNTGPSEIIREIKNMFGINVERFSKDLNYIYRAYGEDELKKRLPSVISTEKNMESILIGDICGEKSSMELFKLYNSMFEALPQTKKEVINFYLSKKRKNYKIANAKNLYFAKNYTYVSQIERYFNCPYAHFMDYGLGLKERKEAKMSSMDIGNIIHKVLEVFFKKITDYKIDDDKIKAAAEEILDEILLEPRLSASFEKSNKALRERIRKECVITCTQLVRRIGCSKYKPFKIEVGFGYGDYDAIKLKAGDETLNFIGKIDRVDKYKNRIIIIDYKTGAVTGKNFDSIYSGKKIQLYMYLSALLGMDKDLLPSGVFYQPINIRYVKEKETQKRFSLIGQVNANPDIIADIDYNFANGKSLFIDGVKKTTKGELSAETEKYALTDEEFYSICRYVNRLAENAVKEISEGYILPSPLGDANNNICSYCNYSNVCGFDKQSFRNFCNIDKNTLLEAVENE